MTSNARDPGHEDRSGKEARLSSLLDASDAVYGTAGIVIEQEYDAAKFDSSELTIGVAGAGDQDIQTTFDLSQLR
jgi:hypothetical protein